MSKPKIRRRGGVSIPRILLCSRFLTVLVAGCLYLYHTALTFYHDRLLDGGSKTLAWFVKEIGLALPFIFICLFHWMVYHKDDPRDGTCRREMFWEVLLVAVLTYAVLLPYLAELVAAIKILGHAAVGRIVIHVTHAYDLDARIFLHHLLCMVVDDLGTSLAKLHASLLVSGP